MDKNKVILMISFNFIPIVIFNVNRTNILSRKHNNNRKNNKINIIIYWFDLVSDSAIQLKKQKDLVLILNLNEIHQQ